MTKDYIKEMCTIIEYRHILGCLFDDDGKQVPIEEEMAIFERMQKNIQQFFPLFQMRIIVVGLKIVGRGQIKEQLDYTIKAYECSKMVVGYDLVCEEDYTPGIEEYLDLLLDARTKLGEEF